MEEAEVMLKKLNDYLIKQMGICSGREDEYNDTINLMCQKIHGFLVRDPNDAMNNLRLIDEVPERERKTMNVFQQFKTGELRDVLGIYLEDQETFIKQGHETLALSKRVMDTTQGDWDPDYKNWRLVTIDLENNDMGIVLVHKEDDEEWRI